MEKSFFAKPSYVKKDWILIDAENAILGRLASRIALILRGKNKPYYTPNIDCGDNVVVINAAKIKVTGNKLEQEEFFWHTNHPGGIKSIKWSKIMSSEFQHRLLYRAVKRMMPKESPLADAQMKKLKIYSGNSHKHEGQVQNVVHRESILKEYCKKSNS
ncbi:50S ribosomal protein L13 [Candidatus Fokinia crypta]|uniref:Large ribosomal subunit protein uL13 n=1 Tax=Candidatus Fokinia crypta TaxID=1920990 RepID=A0ABZ0US72_9RICK|nr:50S ribosomal protein L13 [Candidatus Fokinia cryptica]WPX97998.1 50S ribosomal protein L13 [Candidatus Fokinia cryptica]